MDCIIYPPWQGHLFVDQNFTYHLLFIVLLMLNSPTSSPTLYRFAGSSGVNLADNLMTETTQLYVQRLEEKLHFAEKEVQTMKTELENNQKAHANEIDEIKSRHASEKDETKSRHNGDLKELREDGEKSWMVSTCRLCRLLPTNSKRRAGWRDCQSFEGGGDEDWVQSESNRDWRAQYWQATGET